MRMCVRTDQDPDYQVPGNGRFFKNIGSPKAMLHPDGLLLKRSFFCEKKRPCEARYTPEPPAEKNWDPRVSNLNVISSLGFLGKTSRN